MAWLLSIIIPAFNEEKRIGRSLDEILNFLSSERYLAEVIVVDDGSKDRTVEVVESRAGLYRAAGYDLRVITNDPNRGKGFSVKRGISSARGEIVLFTDADLSSPISEAPKLIDPIAEDRVDLAFGSRALNRKLVGVHQSFVREMGGRTFNIFMRAITGLRYKDTQCGFKAFRRELALPVFQLQRIERFGFDPEILYIARKRELRLMEVPVRWNHVEESKVSYFSDSLNMFIDLARIRLNDFRGRYENARADRAFEEQQAATKQP